MKRKFLIFFTLIMVLIVSITVVACSDYVEPDNSQAADEAIARTQLVSNGTFYNATSSTKDSYIKNNVTGWTATNGSLNTTASGVTMGVIDLSKTDVYAAQINNFSVTDNTEFTNPGLDPKTPFDTDDAGNLTDVVQDSNVLVIASTLEAGSLYYSSNVNITLAANKYYLLQYSVNSLVDFAGVDQTDKDKKGAWVHVSGGVEYLDACINTSGKWETHYLYIETNKDSEKTIKIDLWLGNGPTQINDASNPYVTKGAVMFDNIICNEVTVAQDSKFDNGKETTLNHKNFGLMAQNALSENSRIGFESMYYLTDTKFEQSVQATPTTSAAKNYFYSFREGSYSSDNVTNYNIIKGKADLGDDTAPSYQSATSGIVNLSKLYVESDKTKDTYSKLLSTSYTFKAPTYDEWKNYLVGNNGNRTMTTLDETKALMIYHKDLSGVGFTSKNSLTIEKNAYYEISVWTYVWLPVDTNGDIILPDADKPTEPNAFSSKQKAYNSVYLASKTSGNVLEGYFVLTTAESDVIKDNAVAPASVTSVDDINTLIKSETFLAKVKTWLAKNGLVGAKADRFDDSETAMKDIAANFVFRYLRDVGDVGIVAGDSDYVAFKAIEEESKLLKNTDWTGTNTLIEKWDSFDDNIIAWSAKYTTWKTANDYASHATVKLTGAGVEKKVQTTICNKGYQANMGWEKITFYVQGNQLSSRKLNLEFWFGEGSATEYENLMLGGAIFDNISIIEIEESVAKSAAYINKWDTLSPITKAEQLSVGNLASNSLVTDNWKSELAENVATSDLDKVSLSKIKNATVNDGLDASKKIIEKITIDNVDYDFYSVVLNNQVPTASILTMNTDLANKCLTIKPNTAYRFAVWVKTEGVAKGLGASIDLMGGKDKDELASIANIATFNSEEWKEVVFYVLGDIVDINLINLKFTFGSGTRFSTDGYIQGKLYVSLINYSEIEYSEYNNSTKSGDEVKQYQFKSTVAASSSVSNGNFAEIKYAETKAEEFDDDGILTGVGATSSWTALSAKTNTYTKVSDLSYLSNGADQYTLNWSAVVGIDKNGAATKPAFYELYARFNEEENGKTKTVERICAIISAVDDGTNPSYNGTSKKFEYVVNMTNKARTSFRVKAVSDEAVSLFSSYVALPRVGDEAFITKLASEALVAQKYTAGTVNNSGMFLPVDTDYASPYKTALKIESNYDVAYGLKSSSSSLSANSYYVVSVWVKTIGTAEASVTVSNVSKVLTSNSEEKYIGYTQINTAGKWTQYRFYIKTGTASGSLELELSLGNPYADKVSQKVDSNTVYVYDTAALSKGTVYFDAVKLYTIDEIEYDNAVADGEYNANKTDKLHDFKYLYTSSKNQYASRILEGTIDSFDAFTESTDNSETYYETKGYTWAKASSATGTTLAERQHGVYNYNKDTIEKLKSIYTIPESGDVASYNAFEDFMPINFDIREFLKIDGYNTLVMSNKVPYGQTYTLGENVTINANSYYKLTFKAKTLIAKETITDGKKTYTKEGVNAELRFMQTSSTDSYQSIYINSSNSDDIYDAVTYELYIYNPSSSTKSAQWSFVLGDKENTDDVYGSKQLIIGMMAIDQVSLTKVEESVYLAQSSAYEALSDAEKVKSTSRLYAYNKDDEVPPDDDEETTPEDTDNGTIWDRGDAWLLISSIVIAIVIVIVVVVLIIRRWQKKHPREVKGENILKTEKEIKVIAPVLNKEDILESDEYSDEVAKPMYVQRVVRKGSPKKKKK